MKWEYEVTAYKGDNLAEWLNHLGKDHWRLIFCDLNKNVFIFERLSPDIPFDEFSEDFRRHAEMDRKYTND